VFQSFSCKPFDDAFAKNIKWDGQAKSTKCKARGCRAMRRTYVRGSSEGIAATQQLASFCDAIFHARKARQVKLRAFFI
jgi:hypothetical protein